MRSGRHDAARPRAALLISLLLGAIFVGAWQATVVRQPKGKGLPGPAAVAVEAWEMVRHPFYDNGPNDKGIGLQLGASLGRLMVGYVAGSAVAIMLGVTLGLSPVLYRAVNPYIQVLKPVSPLAWMPLFLYTLKDSGQSAILVIFMSSLGPRSPTRPSGSPRSSATISTSRRSCSSPGFAV